MSAPLLKRCPFPKCSHEADGLMCPLHWSLVPGPLRRKLIAEVKALKAKGQWKPSEEALEALRQACVAIQARARLLVEKSLEESPAAP